MLLLVDFALGRRTPTALQHECADINDDGRINIFDVLLVVDKALGKSILLAASEESGNFPPAWNELRRNLADLGADEDLIGDVRKLFDSEFNIATRLPRAFGLTQNTPNPFNPTTTISYKVPNGASYHVNIKVYDLRGRLVCILVDNVCEAGSYSVFWDGMNSSGQMVPSGIYLYRMRAENFVQTRKMVLLK